MPKPRSHLLDVYDCWLHVATTPKQIAKLQRKYDLPDMDSLGATWLTVDTLLAQTHLTVWLDVKRLDGRRLVDTIAHEATHAGAQLLDHLEQQVDRHDSEALAYLVGWIAGWLWSEVTA